MPADAERSSSGPSFRIGVDIGGTFTDLVVLNEATGELTVGKTLTTPHAPADAVEHLVRDALAGAAAHPEAVRHVVHGTTLVTNAIIERKGAPTALLTTQGFRDAYEIGREHRYELYDLLLDMPRPLVPRYLRLEVDERMYADGSVARALDTESAAVLIQELAEKGIHAIAICLLHSYANPAHEQILAQLARSINPGIHLSLSSEVAPEIREYERTSTTVANVYVQGLVDAYLADLETRIQALGVSGTILLMLSSGGIATLETARAFPIRLLESGPAAGALAASYYGAQAGFSQLMAFDMGGTTAKLCLIEDGQPRIVNDFEVDRAYRFKKGSGLPIKTPVAELIEIGAGGGSIARIDSLGLLQVGPESAGSEPGPACYGRGGTAPTVTDADLVLGYLDERFFLGGSMPLDRAAAERAIQEHLAGPLGISLVEAAWGIHRIANENMANAARIHAIERGRDPGSFPLFAFGGAGPVHAFGVARVLHAPRVVVPHGAGVASSFGFLTAPLAFDFARSRFVRLDQASWPEINGILAELEAEGRTVLRAADVPDDSISFRRHADARYAGQGHEVRIELPGGMLDASSQADIAERFEQAYVKLYGRPGPDVPVEVMSWRVTASGPRPEFTLRQREPATNQAGALKGVRPAFFPEWGEHRDVAVYDRYRLASGVTITGPAIIEERESTAVIGPRARARVDDLGHLHVELES